MGEKPDASGSGLSEGGMSGGPVYKKQNPSRSRREGFCVCAKRYEAQFLKLSSPTVGCVAIESTVWVETLQPVSRCWFLPVKMPKPSEMLV